jgi:hypothetical protein
MHNEKISSVNRIEKIAGTSCKGYLLASYKEIEQLFGPPNGVADNKTLYEWILKSEDGKIVTIYNYKDGYNKNRPKGFPLNKKWIWSIGAHTSDILENLQEKFGYNKVASSIEDLIV